MTLQPQIPVVGAAATLHPSLLSLQHPSWAPAQPRAEAALEKQHLCSPPRGRALVQSELAVPISLGENKAETTAGLGLEQATCRPSRSLSPSKPRPWAAGAPVNPPASVGDARGAGLTPGSGRSP